MKKIMPLSALVIAAGLIYLNCKSGPGRKAIGKGSGDSKSYVFDINFEAGVPPNELVFPASDEEKVSFAWNEFLALHWRSSFYKNNRRDYPDSSWSYKVREKYPDLAVWETYAHRSELRPFSDRMLPFDAPPHYSIQTGSTPRPGSGARFDLFNNLDENNEIGSCYLYGRTDAFPNKGNLVLYQAKANRDEYEYLYTFYNRKERLTNAAKRTANFIATDSAYYPGGRYQGSCNCPILQTVICLPCGLNANPQHGVPGVRGAMEVKTAWRRLAPDEDRNTFITRTVIVYEQMPDKSIQYNNVEYALIGMHIIHKTNNYPNFVFATWEHVDVQKHKMGYVEINKDGTEGPLTVDYPRLHPIPDLVNASTTYVHQELKKLNPQSVLQYYRLVGVQATPVNDSTTFSYFLANYVIESNPTLARFRGSSIQSPFDNQKNSLYKGQGYTMGGCQGCHGAGQTKQGVDLSFLLNNFNKPVDTPDIGSHKNKLLLYIEGMEKAKMEQEAAIRKKQGEKK